MTIREASLRRACAAWQRSGHMGLGRVAADLRVSYSDLVRQVRVALGDWTDYQTGAVLTEADFAETAPAMTTPRPAPRRRAVVRETEL